MFSVYGVMFRWLYLTLEMPFTNYKFVHISVFIKREESEYALLHFQFSSFSKLSPHRNELQCLEIYVNNVFDILYIQIFVILIRYCIWYWDLNIAFEIAYPTYFFLLILNLSSICIS
jgi:hypothetical protein